MKVATFVIVPSGEMSPQGDSIEGLNTEDRVKAAHRFVAEHPEARLIFSGGKLRKGQVHSDAHVMAEYFKKHDCKQPVLLEEEAADTFENIRKCRDIISEEMKKLPQDELPDLIRVVVPSEKNHLRRFQAGFKEVNRRRRQHRALYGSQPVNIPIQLECIQAGRSLSFKEWVFESAFYVLIVLPDPLGEKSKIAARLRESRRAAGRS